MNVRSKTGQHCSKTEQNWAKLLKKLSKIALILNTTAITEQKCLKTEQNWAEKLENWAKLKYNLSKTEQYIFKIYQFVKTEKLIKKPFILKLFSKINENIVQKKWTKSF